MVTPLVPAVEQVGTTAHDVGLHRLAREPADRHDPFLGALAAQQHAAAGGVLELEVVDVEADRLGDAGTGAVEDLEQRPVAQRQRRPGGAGRLEELLDVAERDRLRQPLGRSRRAHAGRRVGRRQPVLDRELVEPAHGHDRAAGRGGAQRLVLPVPLAQRHQEPADGLLGDLVERRSPRRCRGSRGSAAGRGGRTSPSSRRGRARPRGGRGRCGRRGRARSDRPRWLRPSSRSPAPPRRRQSRASSSATDSRPCASATGALVSCPSWVFRPSASEWSSRQACCQPLLASATV